MKREDLLIHALVEEEQRLQEAMTRMAPVVRRWLKKRDEKRKTLVIGNPVISRSTVRAVFETDHRWKTLNIDQGGEALENDG